MRRRNVRLSPAALALIAWGLPVASASAADEAAVPKPETGGLRGGDWLVRAGAIGLFPVGEQSSITVIGGRIDTPHSILPDLSLSYFLTDHIAFEAQGGVSRSRPVIENSLVGDREIGSIWSAAVSGILQYHFLPDRRLNPFLGAGVSYTWPVGIDRGEGIWPFELDPQLIPILQAGVDYRIAGDWFGHATFKYMALAAVSYDFGLVKAKADLDMTAVGIGIGYRF